MVVGEAAGGGNEMSLSNMVLGFYEEAEREMRWPEDATATAGDGSDDDDEGSSPRGGRAESAEFWREQRSLLHAALAKTSSAESRIQADTEEAVRQMRATPGGVCSCVTREAPAAGGCRGCALRFVAERLRDAGYNSAICRSKWSRTPEIPSAIRSRLQVERGAQLRGSGGADEFEMARGGAEYRALVAALPDLFVGRSEKLRAVVRHSRCGIPYHSPAAAFSSGDHLRFLRPGALARLASATSDYATGVPPPAPALIAGVRMASSSSPPPTTGDREGVAAVPYFMLASRLHAPRCHQRKKLATSKPVVLFALRFSTRLTWWPPPT
ncbi:unnamed protein product [Miscanthus lutarioriparius]|uniref:Uncharacterized protein n=1 Tax=Miscanthus lutarioriparius TaxID=422564 RepID=A0A811RX40_9POAL|nr:unnamed protein product [Miscanthus lutarioriparius]